MPRHAGLVAVALTTLLLGCGPAATQAPCPAVPKAAGPAPLTFTSDNDDEALRGIAAHFRTLGWNVAEDGNLKQVVLTSPKAKKYGVRATLQGQGALDRLVLFKAFAIKPEHKGSPKVPELVAKLNNDISGVLYQVTTDGAVVCLICVYFIDTLDPRMVSGAIDLLDEVAIPVMAQKVPELVNLLK
jgi:hypothetical protein